MDRDRQENDNEAARPGLFMLHEHHGQSTCLKGLMTQRRAASRFVKRNVSQVRPSLTEISGLGVLDCLVGGCGSVAEPMSSALHQWHC
jgi:hypothetical protein